VQHAGGRRPRVLLIDFDDSFVHTLANYFRQAGAEVDTRRCGRFSLEAALGAKGAWRMRIFEFFSVLIFFNTPPHFWLCLTIIPSHSSRV
jgi:hypothetical protein